MIYTFETLDGEKFVLDVENSRWGRASSILAAPSIAASENAIARYVYSEEGELISMGGGVYNLDGRMPLSSKPTDEEKKKPGAGLSSVGILNILYKDQLQVYLKPNVQIKDGSFDSGFMQDAAPELRRKYVNYSILQEPPKLEEEKKVVEEK